MTSIFNTAWPDYELLDCGRGEKLERFGKVVLIRPEIQANNAPRLPKKEWDRRAWARFVEQKGKKGSWQIFKKISEKWQVVFERSHHRVVFNLKLTQFKHVGVFPEQSANWDFIIHSLGPTAAGKKILNLFAYTGGASLIARSCGAEITHVESIRQVISWADSNMKSSGLQDVRWMAEDALKFAQREVRRNNNYDGIILDPPTYGLGPKGERWKIEDKLDELLSVISKLVNPRAFVIVNTYSGIDSETLREALGRHMSFQSIEVGDLKIRATSKCEYSTGTVARFIVR